MQEFPPFFIIVNTHNLKAFLSNRLSLSSKGRKMGTASSFYKLDTDILPFVNCYFLRSEIKKSYENNILFCKE